MKIPTKVALNNLASSSNRDEANQVLYIPTKVKMIIQKIYTKAIGAKNNGLDITWKNPDSTFI